MNLLRQLNITKIIVIGDSKQVIQKMNNGNIRGMIKTKRIHECTQQVFGEVQASYIHILRRNNSEVNKLANQGAKLGIGSIKVRGILTNYFYVP